LGIGYDIIILRGRKGHCLGDTLTIPLYSHCVLYTLDRLAGHDFTGHRSPVTGQTNKQTNYERASRSPASKGKQQC
jgi:hypothetical protein